MTSSTYYSFATYNSHPQLAKNTLCTTLACIKAWVNERAYNGEYMDILIIMTGK